MTCMPSGPAFPSSPAAPTAISANVPAKSARLATTGRAPASLLQTACRLRSLRRSARETALRAATPFAFRACAPAPGRPPPPSVITMPSLAANTESNSSRACRKIVSTVRSVESGSWWNSTSVVAPASRAILRLPSTTNAPSLFRGGQLFGGELRIIDKNIRALRPVLANSCPAWRRPARCRWRTPPCPRESRSGIPDSPEGDSATAP